MNVGMIMEYPDSPRALKTHSVWFYQFHFLVDPLVYKHLAYLYWIKKKQKKPPLLKFSDYRMMSSENRGITRREKVD